MMFPLNVDLILNESSTITLPISIYLINVEAPYLTNFLFNHSNCP